MQKGDETAFLDLRAASKDLTSWWSSSTNSPSEWEGVTCDDQGLIKLDFSGCEKLDKLPPEIGKLQSLDSLNLNDLLRRPYRGRDEKCEQLTTLPPEIGNLKALTHLNLNYLHILKALPPEIGKLKQLTKLDCIYLRELKELPPEIGKLVNLKELSLFMTVISHIPPEIKNLKALTRLNLRCCGYLEVIPPEIFELSNLTFLSLGGCTSMREVPCEIGNLKSLTEFEVDHCEKITTLPSEIGRLHNLTVLKMDNNKQLRWLPSSICDLHNLKYLNMRGCPQVTELPSNIGKLQVLNNLNLYECRGLKKLPDSFGQLAELTTLNIDLCYNLLLPNGVKPKPTDGTNRIVAAYTDALMCAPYRDSPGELFTYLENTHLSVPSFFKYILTNAEYADWLGTVAKATPKIANLQDSIGRFPIDVAQETCKNKMEAALHLLERFEVVGKSLLHRSATAAVVEATDHLNSKSSTSVALKAMIGAEQVHAEIVGRLDLEKEYVVSVIAVFADERAVKGNDEAMWCDILAAANKLGIEAATKTGLVSSLNAYFPMQKEGVSDEKESFPDYPFLVVLELADHTLSHTITHQHIAKKDFQFIRHITKQLIESLDHLHESGRGIHADLKPLNVVSVGSRFLLIDLDVFCKLGESFGEKIPSSAYCPPEMAKVMLEAMDENGEITKAKLRKYKANFAYDIWSLGIVLYKLCFAKDFWKIDTDDNIETQYLEILACKSDDKDLQSELDKNLAVFPDASADLYQASLLLRKLLEPNEEKRLKHFPTIEMVLGESFFLAPSKDVKNSEEYVESMKEEMRLIMSSLSTQIRETRNILFKAMLETADVDMPSMFIILQGELPDEEPSDDVKARLLKIVDDGSGLTLGNDNLSVKITGEGMSDVEGKYMDSLKTGKEWVERLGNIGQNFVRGNTKEMFSSIKEGLNQFVTEESMYLYLVDELTGMPVIGGGYPIKIDTPSKIVHKLIPAMQVGLLAMSVTNGVIGIAKLFGFPLNQVPKEWSEGLRGSVELLKQKSSVEKFDVVQEVLDKETEQRQSTSLRGSSLREFQNFLKDNDPILRKGQLKGGFAGLNRIGNPDNGSVLWTVLTDEKKVKEALCLRSAQMKAEKEKSDELFTRLLLDKQKSPEQCSHISQRVDTNKSPRKVAIADISVDPVTELSQDVTPPHKNKKDKKKRCGFLRRGKKKNKENIGEV